MSEDKKLEELRRFEMADIEAARKLVAALCENGEKAWRMSILHRRDDSDHVLMRVIEYARAAADREAQLRDAAEVTDKGREAYAAAVSQEAKPTP